MGHYRHASVWASTLSGEQPLDAAASHVPWCFCGSVCVGVRLPATNLSKLVVADGPGLVGLVGISSHLCLEWIPLDAPWLFPISMVANHPTLRYDRRVWGIVSHCHGQHRDYLISHLGMAVEKRGLVHVPLVTGSGFFGDPEYRAPLWLLANEPAAYTGYPSENVVLWTRAA